MRFSYSYQVDQYRPFQTESKPITRRFTPSDTFCNRPVRQALSKTLTTPSPAKDKATSTEKKPPVRRRMSVPATSCQTQTKASGRDFSKAPQHHTISPCATSNRLWLLLDDIDNTPETNPAQPPTKKTVISQFCSWCLSIKNKIQHRNANQ